MDFEHSHYEEQTKFDGEFMKTASTISRETDVNEFLTENATFFSEPTSIFL